MNWQDVSVYVILAVCGLLLVHTLRKSFSKKQSGGHKCANCSCECKLRDTFKK